jgi:NTP pyrophosphatase (non-canonical NTP hydrolase)
MTLDEYVARAADSAGGRDDRTLLEVALGFASKIGEVAGVLARRRPDRERRDELAGALGDVAYYWARLCVGTGMAPSVLLARSRAHVEWRRAGRPAGGPPPAGAPLGLEEFTAWAADPSEASPRDIALALVGDAGEVVECLRALARDGDRHRERLAGELGDVWRHWTRLCVASGLTPADLLARRPPTTEG